MSMQSGHRQRFVPLTRNGRGKRLNLAFARLQFYCPSGLLPKSPPKFAIGDTGAGAGGGGAIGVGAGLGMDLGVGFLALAFFLVDFLAAFFIAFFLRAGAARFVFLDFFALDFFRFFPLAMIVLPIGLNKTPVTQNCGPHCSCLP
jgi:hypothetical protein